MEFDKLLPQGFTDEGLDKIILDSRKNITDGLFVPIVGEKSDGHDYIEMAINNGARAVLSMRPVKEMEAAHPDVKFYEVDDTKTALQAIGYMERQKFTGPVIGVTGSVGKTTTRNMISCALAASKSVFQTAGNANSQVGVPITMFQMAHSGAEIAVVELGMSEPGEMTRIANVACVDIAVMTNIGSAHLEQLKTRENILKEKLHILDGTKDGGTLLLNGDDEMLSKVTMEMIHSYGIAADRNFNIIYYKKGDYDIELSVKGSHMLENAMAALHVAEITGADLQGATAALEAFTGLKGRGETFTTKDDVIIIDDAYNASPVSMKAGLDVLNELKGQRKIAVLADMLELGKQEEEFHKSVGTYLASLNIDLVCLLGKRAAWIGDGIKSAENHASLGDRENTDSGKKKTTIEYFDDLGELTNTIKSIASAGDVILFKGSNSMKLSEIVAEFSKERR